MQETLNTDALQQQVTAERVVSEPLTQPSPTLAELPAVVPRAESIAESVTQAQAPIHEAIIREVLESQQPAASMEPEKPTASKKATVKTATQLATARKPVVAEAVPPDVVEVDSPERAAEVSAILPEPQEASDVINWDALLGLRLAETETQDEAEESRHLFEQTLADLEAIPVLPAAPTGENIADDVSIPAAEDSTGGQRVTLGEALAAIGHRPTSSGETRYIEPVEVQREWVWEVANEEPPVVLESFTNSLIDLIHAEAMPGKQEPAAIAEGAQLAETDLSDAELLPLIVTEIAQKLSDLEPAEKEAIAPIVKNVAEAVQEVRLLELSEASPAEVLIATERLTELVAELFESLGIECDPDTVKQFVAVILRQQFMPAPERMSELDLEHVGTHEVKRNFPSLTAAFFDFFIPLHHVLGTFAVRTSSPRLLDELLAADKVTA